MKPEPKQEAGALDPWIIEEIQKREQERKEEQKRERLEIQIDEPHTHDESDAPPKERDRGVAIITPSDQPEEDIGRRGEIKPTGFYFKK
ncbi:MAG TPA: hypothetical protein VJA27_01265 [Patescibacteria group bacterium]|nr:hypothetical protein [Patescibacteria group bacterium]